MPELGIIFHFFTFDAQIRISHVQGFKLGISFGTHQSEILEEPLVSMDSISTFVPSPEMIRPFPI